MVVVAAAAAVGYPMAVLKLVVPPLPLPRLLVIHHPLVPPLHLITVEVEVRVGMGVEVEVEGKVVADSYVFFLTILNSLLIFSNSNNTDA